MLLLHVCNETAQLQFYFQGLHFLHTKIKFKNCIPIELLKIFSCISRGGGGGIKALKISVWYSIVASVSCNYRGSGHLWGMKICPLIIIILISEVVLVECIL